MPVVAGHEGAGIVEAVGEGVDQLQTGDHVILNWAPACGECFYCQHDQTNLCDTYTAPIWAGTMLDGTSRLHRGDQTVYSYCGLAAFASHTVVIHQSCVKIPKTVPLESAALIGCAVATGVGAAMFTAKVNSGECVAVVGCGGVGLNCIQGARLCRAGKIIAIDTSADKAILAKRLGATDVVISANPREVIEKVRALTQGRGTDHAFEAVGVPALQELAFELARPGGTVTLAGLSPMGSGTNLPGAQIVRQEKTIKGSYYGSVNAARDFAKLIEFYSAGTLKLDELITRRYSLEQINEAFSDMLRGKLARGVIVI
jgi:S-(hydroxymethyl)glutathione dehydrogenase/alcohol dehydrogenase